MAFEKCAVGGKVIKCWGLHQRVADTTERVTAKLVERDEEDVLAHGAPIFVSAPSGARTQDLRIKSPLLYQLS